MFYSEQDNTSATPAPDEKQTPRLGVAVGRYINRISIRLLWRMWWMPLIPVAGLIAGWGYDWRIAVISLMLIFIIFPFIVTMAIFVYAMRPEVVMLSKIEKIDIADDSLTFLDADSKTLVEVRSSQITSIVTRTDMIEIVYGSRPDKIILLNRKEVGKELTQLIVSKFAPEDVLN